MEAIRVIRQACVLALALALFVGVVAAVRLELVATRIVQELPGQIGAARTDLLDRTERQIESARIDALQEIDAQASTLQAQVYVAQRAAFGEIDAARGSAVWEIDRVRATADRRVGDTLGRVDVALAGVGAALNPVVTKVTGIEDHVGSIVAHVDDALPQFTDCAWLDDTGVPVGANEDCAFNRFQGASKAIERAAQDFAAATDEFRGAAPGVEADIRRAAKNSADASASTAKVMSNFAKATTPLPRWLRVALAVAPPAAQVGYSVIGSLSLAGR